MVRTLWLAPECCQPGEVTMWEERRSWFRSQSRSFASRQHGFQVEQIPLVRACDEPVIAGDVPNFRGAADRWPKWNWLRQCRTCSIGGGANSAPAPQRQPINSG